jgi:hypothetical protein
MTGSADRIYTGKGGFLLKKAIPPALLFLFVCSACLWSETMDCRQSFELRKAEAEELHRSRPWYWIGIASGFSALIVFNATDVVSYDSSGYEDSRASLLPFVCFLSVLAAPLVPARLVPRRAHLFPADEEAELQCYRDGYLRKAHAKNTRSLLYGELTAGGVVVLASLLFVTAMY